MNKFIKRLIIAPFALIALLIAGLIVAGLIHDANSDGTHFNREVTFSKDAKLIKSDYWGFVDLTTRFHFSANPETIESIINDKELISTKVKEVPEFGLPKIEEWSSAPGEISTYKRNFYDDELLDAIYILQHNQQKNEAFFITESF